MERRSAVTNKMSDQHTLQQLITLMPRSDYTIVAKPGRRGALGDLGNKQINNEHECDKRRVHFA